ncbi:fatty acid synthase alpha subunit Lsd1, partial [Coemansia javaensis]
MSAENAPAPGLQDAWGNELWKRGSLAVWGLPADDIGLASFHGTSPVANDKDKLQVPNAKMRQPRRTPSHVLPAACQEWPTVHSKGAAAGFMLNGVIQSMRTGLVPGNRNADNISAELRDCDYSVYLSRMVGDELLVVHPDYLLATLNKETL